MRIREAVAATHRGKRGFNEDAVLRMPKVPLFAVSDGMGGPGAGDIAAGLALELVKRNAEPLAAANAKVARSRSTTDRLALARLVDELFNRASREVQREATRLQRPGMGSTLVLATVVRNYAYVAHVGNSRAYLYREGKLLRLTEDHTIAELHYRRGKLSRDQYESSPDRRMLYQALGAGVEVDGDLAEVRLVGGDLLVLCSDGLPHALGDEGMAQCIDPRDLKGSLARLIETAVSKAASDNLSAVIVALEGEPEDEPIEAVTEVMREVFLFRDMTQPELLTIAPYLEEVVVDKDATLVTENEVWPGFYVLISGNVRLSRGKSHITDVKRGGSFGEIGLARRPEKGVNVRALVPSRLFLLSRDRFHELLRQKPEMGGRLLVALVDAMSDRVRDLGERLFAVERASRGELR